MTHKILVMIVCEEVLQTAGPVAAAAQQTEHAFLAAHVAVPRVLFDGGVRRPLTDEQVDTLHAETPAHRKRRVNEDEWNDVPFPLRTVAMLGAFPFVSRTH